MSDVTRDEILAMPAGPEMDELVRVRVLRRGPDLCFGEDAVTGNPTSWRGTLPYSADIAAAWEVRDVFRGGLFSRRQAFTDLLQTVISDRLRLEHGRIAVSEVFLNVLPEDICRAALLTAIPEAA